MDRVIIIGGVAGGMSAATRLRRLLSDVEIVVYDKGPYVSFANCGLPYHVSGEIAEREKLIVQTPEALKSRFDIDVKPNHEVIAISPENKTVTVKFDGKMIEDHYDKLILSPGAKAFIPPIEGLAEAENTVTLRNVPDLDVIMARLNQSNTKNAVVIGAGYIGLEMAENLRKRGLSVTIVEKASHVLPSFDEEMAAYVHNELVANDVAVLTGQSAVAFQDKGKVVQLEDGTQLKSDLTLLSVGVQPENTLAEAAGLTLGHRGGIVVNDQYQTSNSDIYAVGDAIVVNQQILTQDALISLASPANRQGRQVADVIAGLNRKNKGSIGTAIVRAFDIVAGSTGLSERVAKMNNLSVHVLHLQGKNHAGYYPGAENILLKVIFDKKSGTIYGAQAIGADGIDKRIDILATAIKANMTIEDLPELEFTYAPPFGAAKDIVNMAGYAGLNLMENLSEAIQWHELEEEVSSGAVLLDVRNTAELKQGRFKDSVHIPLDNLSERLNELDQSKQYIVSCHSGLRSYIAERLLKNNGFTVKNLDGAFALYQTIKPEALVYV
ncbi:FAD-dependent oxidoreductase [Marinilactibacillus sp. XAAS-LB27]|uniref:FAD-dependent oxidoreductase n=1 Tax=Marinilactibacillus sp. XAAS-LB27 TaxID=3114538 RepID=UPI002E16F66E|nr:FAD-dependent oxidoreductase [Marinilactibacillus sp. XAAS-LB27]